MDELKSYLLFWPVLMVIAVLNGVLREASYSNSLSELHAHQVSTVTAAVAFGAAVALLGRVVIPASSTQAIWIGLTWLIFTLCFEFLFGRYVAGHTWSRLFQDYDLSSGRIWILLLAWITLLPYLVYRLYDTAT